MVHPEIGEELKTIYFDSEDEDDIDEVVTRQPEVDPFREDVLAENIPKISPIKLQIIERLNQRLLQSLPVGSNKSKSPPNSVGIKNKSIKLTSNILNERMVARQTPNASSPQWFQHQPDTSQLTLGQPVQSILKKKHYSTIVLPDSNQSKSLKPKIIPHVITVAEVHHGQQRKSDLIKKQQNSHKHEKVSNPKIPSKNSSQVTFEMDENMENWSAQRKKEKKMKKCDVNQVKLTPDQELTRFRLQFFCECLSLTTMVLAVIFVIITPFLLIPIWVIPSEYSLLLGHIMGIFILLSVVFLALTGILGNIYWYFDPKKNKWRCMLHCGKGPTDHFWGNTLFYDDETASTLSTSSIPTNLEIAKFKNHMVHDV